VEYRGEIARPLGKAIDSFLVEPPASISSEVKVTEVGTAWHVNVVEVDCAPAPASSAR
jgi:hypothetical protein